MVYLRKLIEEDLVSLWEIAYSQSNPIWKQYDAPYYDDYQHFPNFQEFKLQKSESTLNNSNRLGIFVDDKLVGTVSRYWVCKQTRWMELGICIYDKKFLELWNWKSCYATVDRSDISGLLGVGASWFDNLVRKSWYGKTC